MDTGLGREGYSNIGQGRIDEILSLKSGDRREIFEEAAGISKYRHRKEETERQLERTEDHQLSLSLMRECGYDSAFMFKYSERPGTYASKHLPDDVSEETKIRRLNEMIALQNELSAESYRKDVGKTYEVLVEGVSKRSKDQLFGRTSQNKVVVFDRAGHHIPAGPRPPRSSAAGPPAARTNTGK